MAEDSSYFPNYYSLEDILASQERIPCKFELPVYGLGYIDPSSGNKDLEVGCKLKLPCWLAKDLCSSRRHIVSAELPVIFAEKYRQILKAEPEVVNLHKLGPHFYEYGQHVLPLAGTEGPALALLLSQTLRERIRKISDSSQNASHDDYNEQTAKLDELEKSLFKTGQASLKDHNLWLSRKAHILTTAAMVQSHNKRKFAEISTG